MRQNTLILYFHSDARFLGNMLLYRTDKGRMWRRWLRCGWQHTKPWAEVYTKIGVRAVAFVFIGKWAVETPVIRLFFIMIDGESIAWCLECMCCRFQTHHRFRCTDELFVNPRAQSRHTHWKETFALHRFTSWLYQFSDLTSMSIQKTNHIYIYIYIGDDDRAADRMLQLMDYYRWERKQHHCETRSNANNPVRGTGYHLWRRPCRLVRRIGCWRKTGWAIYSWVSEYMRPYNVNGLWWMHILHDQKN